MEEKNSKLSKFTLTDFIFCSVILKSWTFKKLSRGNFKTTLERLGLEAPRRIKGSKETSFIYSHENGYSVIIHTTWVEEDGKWRDIGDDAVWVLIVKGDKALYFAKPIARREGFIEIFLRYAWVSKWKVDHRPLCPESECRAYMEIMKRQKGKGYFWGCNKKKYHSDHKFITLEWDYELPPKATAFLKIRRESTAKYKARLQKAGKVVVPARVKRKIWVIKKPQNLQ